MHILPSNKIPFHKVPLDVMITNKLNFVKKHQKVKKAKGKENQEPKNDIH